MNQSSEVHAASGGREHGRQLLGGCPTVQRHREAQFVVDAFPLAESGRGRLEQLEGMPAPKLLGVNPVTALDLAVLLGPARLNVAVANARSISKTKPKENSVPWSVWILRI